MKQNRWMQRMGALALAVVLTMGAVAAAAVWPAGEAGRDKALDTALKAAGLERSQVKRVDVDRDEENGRQVWEVEFFHRGTEYDYTLDAADGTILRMERDEDDRRADARPTGREMGREAAVQAVLEKVGLKQNQAEALDVDLKEQGGLWYYEVEFQHRGMEYEFRLNAVTGQFFRVREQVMKPRDRAGEQKIGRRAAVEIVLKQEAYTEQQVRDLTVELEHQEGRLVYEVAFRHGGVDYQFHVDAYTGQVLLTQRALSAVKPQPEQPEQPEKPEVPQEGRVDRDEALRIALKRAGWKEPQVSDIEVELDREEGRLIYEVEFQHGDTEYEVEVDASTGAVVDFEEDTDDEDDDDWDDEDDEEDEDD